MHELIRKGQGEDGGMALGYTYTAHPTSCAAALKNIEILERENICEHAREVGPYLQNKAKDLLDISIVGDVRGSHLMMGIELVTDKIAKASFDSSVGVSDRVFKYAQERGVVVRPVGNTIVLSPPLIITKEECDTIINVLRESISLTARDLQGEGLIAA